MLGIGGRLVPVEAIARNGKMAPRHSALVRVCHWINALAFSVLVMSGLQIFNAHPELNFGEKTDFEHPGFALKALESDGNIVKGETVALGRAFDTTGWLGASREPDGTLEPHGFPRWVTLPSIQDLATGRRWHFFFAWMLVLNGLVYLVDWTLRRRWSEFVPNRGDWRGLPHTLVDHIKLKFPRSVEALRYNVLQKLAYLSVLMAFPILILAGLTMSPGMNAAFPWLVDLFGGRQSARSIHFILAAYLVFFLFVHLVMVILSGPINNLRGMITGRYRITEDAS
jgi:thiosulfate reductase cytochrome b subunit